MTTKVLALTGALGTLVRCALSPGRRFDMVGVAPRIEGPGFDARIADKAFDGNAIIGLNARGARIVIPRWSRREQPLDIDTELHEWRHLTGTCVGTLTAFGRIARRAGKTDTRVTAAIHPAAAVIHAR